MVADTQTQFLVWGFTDTVGTAELQPGPVRASCQMPWPTTSRARACRVTVWSIQGFGKTNLAVPTPDQTPEAANRRVEIRRR